MTRLFAFVLSAAVVASAASCDDQTAAPGGDGIGGAGGGPSSTSTGAGATPNALVGAQLGDPRLASAQRLAFGPGGVLLIGDGRSNRIVAVETGDTSTKDRAGHGFDLFDQLTTAAADAIGGGVSANELQIEDIAVNPLSHRTYVAVTRLTTQEAHVLWLGADGELHRFGLDRVVHAVHEVAPAEGGIANVGDVAWTDEHIVGTITPQSFSRHELTFARVPFEHEGGVRRATTEIYHPTWQQWLTQLPMDRFFTYLRDEELVLVGSFSSVVVAFPAATLSVGAPDVRGTTLFELLDGRTVHDFLAYERGGALAVVVLVQNFAFDGQAAAVWLDGELFARTESEGAPVLFDFAGSSLVRGAERAPALDRAHRIDAHGDEHAVVLRSNTLERVRLPMP